MLVNAKNNWLLLVPAWSEKKMIPTETRCWGRSANSELSLCSYFSSFLRMSDNMMTPQQKEWLDANHEHLLEAQVPALSILSSLVAGRIFDTRQDDYQTIVAQDALHKQICTLLNALKSKSKAAFTAFITALETHCLHALKQCTTPPDIIRQFDSDVRKYYHTLGEEEILAFSWLERTSSGLKISDYLRHLVIVDTRRNEALADSDNLASSAKELERHKQLHSRPEKVELVELENIFGEEPQPSRGRLDVDRSSDLTGECRYIAE